MAEPRWPQARIDAYLEQAQAKRPLLRDETVAFYVRETMEMVIADYEAEVKRLQGRLQWAEFYKRGAEVEVEKLQAKLNQTYAPLEDGGLVFDRDGWNGYVEQNGSTFTLESGDFSLDLTWPDHVRLCTVPKTAVPKTDEGAS